MTGWRVTKFTNGSDGGPPTYSVMAQLTFTSKEGLPTAFESEKEAVLGDVPNFSDQKPVILAGEVAGKHGDNA